MKSKVFGVSLGSVIFILLLVAVLAVVRPVYLRISESLSKLENTLVQKLEDETGLSLSYDSLSPSIFIGVNFKNISIYDVATKNKIAGIKRANLSYNVFGFFSKNPTVALKELALNGVTVEYDAMQDFKFIDKIKNLLEERKKAKSEKTADSEESEKMEIAADGTLSAEKNTKISIAEREFDIPLKKIQKFRFMTRNLNFRLMSFSKIFRFIIPMKIRMRSSRSNRSNSLISTCEKAWTSIQREKLSTRRIFSKRQAGQRLLRVIFRSAALIFLILREVPRS